MIYQRQLHAIKIQLPSTVYTPNAFRRVTIAIMDTDHDIDIDHDTFLYHDNEFEVSLSILHNSPQAAEMRKPGARPHLRNWRPKLSRGKEKGSERLDIGPPL